MEDCCLGVGKHTAYCEKAKKWTTPCDSCGALVPEDADDSAAIFCDRCAGSIMVVGWEAGVKREGHWLAEDEPRKKGG